MTVEVRWTATAREHILAIGEYLSHASPIYAERWIDRILHRTDQLARFPESGRMVPEARDAAIRELLEGPWRIIYLVQPTRVDILAVVHGRQAVRWSGESPGSDPSAG